MNILRLVTFPIRLLQGIGGTLKTILGVPITLATLPGLVLSNYLRARVCRDKQIPNVRFEPLRLGWPPSQLWHDDSATIAQRVAIHLIPLLQLSVPALAALFVARAFMLNDNDVPAVFFGYIGVTLSAYAFPPEPIHLTWAAIRDAVKRGNWWAICALPLLPALIVLDKIEGELPISFGWPFVLWIVAFYSVPALG